MTDPSTLARVLAAGLRDRKMPYPIAPNDRRITDIYRAAIRRPFRVVVADPPWPFGDKLPGPGRGAAKHYDLLSIDDIRDGNFMGGSFVTDHGLDTRFVADDAYLFLWRVCAGSRADVLTLVEEAYAVARAWQFAPKTELVWCKETRNGKQHFGMGRHLRMAHEACIVATRGKAAPLARNLRSVLHAPASRQHSAKPEEFYTELVEKISKGPYLELFARRQRPGWTCIGDEVTPSATPSRMTRR